LVVASWDSTAWLLALTVSCWLRYELDASQIRVYDLLTLAAMAAVVQVIGGLISGLYQGRYWIDSIEEALGVSAVMCVVGFSLFLANSWVSRSWVPRSVPIMATLVAIALAGLARLGFHFFCAYLGRRNTVSARKVIVFGAGAAGQQLVRSMRADITSGYKPVAIIDDDPRLLNKRISGVSVVGDRKAIAAAAVATGAELLVVAVPSASSEAVGGISRAAIDAGLGVKVLPTLSELLRPWVGFADLRDLDILDLLGRPQLDTKISDIAGYLSNRKVLVTGAGGSIGTELCRQIHQFGPAELIMLDRDESALHGVQLSLYGSALLDTSDVVLADIRDAEVMNEIFRSRRPDVVFHAAALKHLPMLEQYPDEAWKTNVVGTMNVLDAARASGVDKLINISTDKAANPTSVLGRSKRIGERLIAHAPSTCDGVFLSVRFGNVLGSRGSVLTTFTEQLATGGPITVTHPEVTRFFMTIPEAVQLVIQAGAIGSSGEVLVLDMGEPVSILSVAHQLMQVAGKPVDVVFTGLRDGEKLHEELFGEGEERDHRPLHPAISHVSAPPLNPMRMLDAAAVLGCARALVELTEDTTVSEPVSGPITSQTDVTTVRTILRRQPPSQEFD
jgi:FlaA1/EpsC-like NDP-sugar epimerase